MEFLFEGEHESVLKALSPLLFMPAPTLSLNLSSDSSQNSETLDDCQFLRHSELQGLHHINIDLHCSQLSDFVAWLTYFFTFFLSV